MSGGNDQLADAVCEAGQLGEITAPSELLALIAGLENPIVALQDMDRSNELFAAFNNEFAFINRARFTKTAIQAADQSRYASLLRWLIRELRGWRRAEDTDYRKLVAVFIVAQVCDFNSGLWEPLPDDIGDNTDLTNHLKGLVESFSVTFTPRRANVPTRQSEAVERFKQADAEGDWVAVINGWQQFPLFFANTLQIQVVRLLYRYSISRLVEGLAGTRQTAVAMLVASVLTIEQKLRLAIASANPYVQLSSAYRVFTDGGKQTKLTSGEELLLIELLLKVANDTPRWAAWMQIFNTYPVRYPALQTPLGRTLAKAPESAIDPYISSISLYPKEIKQDPGRQCIAECLREFRAKASLERRSALWTVARQRWLKWCFNRADSNYHLFGIHWSDLDYAVVAYACECMDEAGRTAALEEILKEMTALDDAWHACFTDLVTSWNRLLSKLQPYAQAAAVAGTNEDWLIEKRTYWPFDQSKNLYLSMKYRVM